MSIPVGNTAVKPHKNWVF